MRPMAEGVGVNRGGVTTLFGFLFFLGDGVAGGGIVIASATLLPSSTTSVDEVVDDNDSLVERRTDMIGTIVFIVQILTLLNMQNFLQCAY